MRLIDADALKEQIKTELANVPQPDTDADYYIGVKQGLKFADAIIDNAPTVTEDYSTGYQDGLEDGLDDIRPQGGWIERTEGFFTVYTCNKCNGLGGINDNFCPKCGAKMKGDITDE